MSRVFLSRRSKVSQGICYQQHLLGRSPPLARSRYQFSCDNQDKVSGFPFRSDGASSHSILPSLDAFKSPDGRQTHCNSHTAKRREAFRFMQNFSHRHNRLLSTGPGRYFIEPNHKTIRGMVERQRRRDVWFEKRWFETSMSVIHTELHTTSASYAVQRPYACCHLRRGASSQNHTGWQLVLEWGTSLERVSDEHPSIN